MNRRSFLKRTAALSAGTALSPFILPSGRLFARTGSRRVGHVVFCLFAGGVRNIESVHQAEGNLMPALFPGSPSQIPGLDPIPASPHSQLLSSEGVLFQELRYREGPTGHFNGHTVAVTGHYTDTGLNLRENPQMPTIFEYYLKHNSPAQTARNAWWISNALGPYPALNYSRHPSYGPAYGANHIAPTALLSSQTFPAIGNPKQFQFHEEEKVNSVRNFLNQNFDKQAGGAGFGITNTAQDARDIQDFIQSLVEKGENGGFRNPLGINDLYANNDIYTILFAEEVIREFKPELLTVNMTDVDICHQNFTQYCNNLRKADYAVAHLWHSIQSTPGMADDTLLVIVPEHGRNLEPNTLQDVYGRFALDHTGDATSREIFALLVGPPNLLRRGQVVGSASDPVGESIDIVPTIAHALGFDVDIPGGLLPGRVLSEAFT
jgi:hypothetical protein